MTPRARVGVQAAVTVAVSVVGWWGFESSAGPETSRFNTALVTGVFAVLVTVALVGGWRRPTDAAPARLFAASLLATVSYFRFLEPSWLAVLGATVWLASPIWLLQVFTEPARRGRLPASRRWNAIVVVLAVGIVVVSGPTTGTDTARRAMSWAWFDPTREVWARQTNPAEFWASDAAVIALSAGWCAAVAIATIRILGRTSGRWWQAVCAVGVAATIVLALPVRLGGRGFLLDRAVSELLIAVPLICLATYAAWAVWSELITPRLVRPTALVMQLDEQSSIASTRRRLARVLGDPSARVVYAAADGWVDESGRRVSGSRDDRRLVTVTRNGVAVAALEMDVVTDVAPDLLVDAAGSLVVSLEAQQLAALAEAAAADARQAALRLVEVDREAIDELTRAIDAGPQRTLAGVEALLEARPLPLDRIHDELRHALEQVRSIAHRATMQTDDSMASDRP